MRRRRQPAARPRLGPGRQGRHRRDQDGLLMAAEAPFIGKAKGKVDARRGRLRRALPRTARARGGARGAAARAGGHRVHQDSRRGRGDRRQGLAPEGHRPRPRRRALGCRSWTGGGVAFGPKPRGYTVKVNRKARRARAARALSRARRARHARGASTPRRFDDALHQGRRPRRWRASTAAAACSWCSAPRTRRPAPSPSATSTGVKVLPADAVGVADVVGAARLVVSRGRARAASPRGSRAPRERDGGEP